MGTPEATLPSGSLELVGQRVVTQLQRRLALFAVEVTEEELRFARLLGWQLLALFLSCLSLLLLSLMVVSAWWDSTHRVDAIAWAGGITALAAGLLWTVYNRQLQQKPVVFAQTLLELERDAHALDPRATEPRRAESRA